MHISNAGTIIICADRGSVRSDRARVVLVARHGGGGAGARDVARRGRRLQAPAARPAAVAAHAGAHETLLPHLL